MDTDRESSRVFRFALTIGRAADHLAQAAMPGIQMILVVLLAGTVFLAFDRTPPFELLVPDYPPPVVAPGESVELRSTVRRDTYRDCSVTMARRQHFSDGRRKEMAGEYFSAAEIAIQQFRTPGRMAPVVDVPTWAPDGRADLVSTLRYRCGNNPWHWLFPIEVVTVMPFIVQKPPA